MTTNLYSFVGLFSRQLDTAAHILAKGAAHAAATGVSETDMLGWRLIEDMSPLSFQLMLVCNFARAWPARVAGLPPPADITADLAEKLDVAGFQAAIAEAKTCLATLTPEPFAGHENAPLTVTADCPIVIWPRALTVVAYVRIQ